MVRVNVIDIYLVCINRVFDVRWLICYSRNFVSIFMQSYRGWCFIYNNIWTFWSFCWSLRCTLWWYRRQCGHCTLCCCRLQQPKWEQKKKQRSKERKKKEIKKIAMIYHFKLNWSITLFALWSNWYRATLYLLVILELILKIELISKNTYSFVNERKKK